MKYPTNTRTANSKDPTTVPIISVGFWLSEAEVVWIPVYKDKFIGTAQTVFVIKYFT